MAKGRIRGTRQPYNFGALFQPFLLRWRQCASFSEEGLDPSNTLHANNGALQFRTMPRFDIDG